MRSMDLYDSDNDSDLDLMVVGADYVSQHYTMGLYYYENTGESLVSTRRTDHRLTL